MRCCECAWCAVIVPVVLQSLEQMSNTASVISRHGSACLFAFQYVMGGVVCTI